MRLWLFTNQWELSHAYVIASPSCSHHRGAVMTIVEFPTAKAAARRAVKRAAASKPRNSKNGTPEERATKANGPVRKVPFKPRRSKNGTPQERAAKKASATVVDVTSRRERRAAATRATRGEPMTKEEFAAYYDAATPAEQAIIWAKLKRLIAEKNGRPPDQPA